MRKLLFCLLALAVPAVCGATVGASAYPVSERMVRECGIRSVSDIVHDVSDESGANCMARFMGDQRLILEVITAMGRNPSLLEEPDILACGGSLGALFGLSGIEVDEDNAMGMAIFCAAAYIGGAG